MKLPNLVPFLIPLVLLSSGCSHPPKTIAPAVPAVEAKPVVKPAFVPPAGWKTVSGDGFAFAVPKTVSEVKSEKTEDSPKFTAKSADNKFLLSFDFRKDVKTVKRMSGQILESLQEMDAEIQTITQVEIDEHDGAAFLAVHGDNAFLVFVFVKDQVGYQISCGTPDKSEGQAMVDSCEAIAETFKFTK